MLAIYVLYIFFKYTEMEGVRCVHYRETLYLLWDTTLIFILYLSEFEQILQSVLLSKEGLGVVQIVTRIVWAVERIFSSCI